VLNIWTPSDDTLQHDPIALQKIKTPFEPPDLDAHGITLFDVDVDDDDANAAAACLVLAALDPDDASSDEPGDCYDDEAIDDPEDLDYVTGNV
jgi:hypothetical protein